MSPRGIALLYSEDDRQLIISFVDEMKLTDVSRSALKMPIFLDEYGMNLNDEFAHQLGGALLNALAESYPRLKQHLHVTPPAQAGGARLNKRKPPEFEGYSNSSALIV